MKPVTPWKAPWHLILIFLLLSVGILTTGYFYYQNQYEHLKTEKQDELAAIAELKVKQISEWRHERLADSMSLMEDHFLAARVRDWLAARSAPALREEILNRISYLQRLYHYPAVALLDASGTLRLSAAEQEQVPSLFIKTMAQQAMREKRVVFSDLYRAADPSQAIQLSILVPLQIKQKAAMVAVGAILLQIDPFQFLYPLIQSWPTPSPTAECALVRRNGNEVVYLNELRHRENSALLLHFSLDTPNLPAAMVARGVKGIVEGVDYRGVPVLAAVSPVPETPWFLIAKVDVREVYAPLRDLSQIVAFLLIVLIAGAGSGVALVWRHQHARFYQDLYETERQRAALAQRFEFLTKHANDIILLTCADRKILEANDRALESYGYEQEELLKLSLRDLHPPEVRALLEDQLQKVAAHEGLVFETVQLRKDGTTFPAEISSRLMEVEGEKFYQHIVRDITDRKEAEAALKESAEKLRFLTTKILTVQEDERRRLSREIHDGLGQPLLALKMHIRAIEKQLPEERPEIKQAFETTFNNINDIVEDLRRMSWALSPSVLEDVGLAAALESLCEEFSRLEGLICAIDLDEVEGLLYPEAKINIYRVFQEGLSNISKYAQATRVSITAKRDGNYISFLLEDNGRGFNAAEIFGSRRGLGLAAMDERVRIINGSFTISSEEGQGTRIAFSVPIDPARRGSQQRP